MRALLCSGAPLCVQGPLSGSGPPLCVQGPRVPSCLPPHSNSRPVWSRRAMQWFLCCQCSDCSWLTFMSKLSSGPKTGSSQMSLYLLIIAEGGVLGLGCELQFANRPFGGNKVSALSDGVWLLISGLWTCLCHVFIQSSVCSRFLLQLNDTTRRFMWK